MTLATRDWQEPLPELLRGGAASVGNFDGVHVGHAALVAELRRQATLCGGPAVAVTFDPHPLDLLRPDRRQPLLTTLDDRLPRLLHDLGAEHVVVLRSTMQLAWSVGG